MKALITGASSGIGRAIAKVLHARGCKLILTARNMEQLEQLQAELGGDVEIFAADLRDKEQVLALYHFAKDRKVDILINNAGFGVFGAFEETDLATELDMLDVNLRALHMLTKLFLRDFRKRDRGYILNVSSSAAFLPGPLMAAYYAGKAYVLRLTQAIHEELRKQKSRVYIGALCPGPVDTAFSERAGVRFNLPGLSSEKVAEYAVQKMFERKAVIVPGAVMQISQILNKLTPDSVSARVAYHIQQRKQPKKPKKCTLRIEINITR